MKVLFLPEVRVYFRKLIETLYQKNYFGFEDTAIKYVEELFNDIESTLPTKVKKIAPERFDIYGKNMFYSVFKKNKRTEWYVFFNVYQDKEAQVYLVRYISNNHVIAQLL